MGLTMRERKAVTGEVCRRYRKATKKDKGRILDEFVRTTGFNRGYARWLLRQHGRRVQVRPGVLVQGDGHLRPERIRPRTYGPEVLEPLKKVWTLLDYPASKRLAAALPEVVPHLLAQKALRLNKAVQQKLLAISAATIDRLLKPERQKHQLKGRSHTKPGTLLKHQVPIRTFADWDDARPGFLEIDLVGHDGGRAYGEYCYTLNITDVDSGWTELAAIQNKAEIWVFEALTALRNRLPFPLLGLDSDNGSEFINHHLVRYCQTEHITFTRSRPYRKNDTCYVEQKNWSVVRRYVGYARYETQEARALLNELDRLLSDYVNFFQPSMKLQEKTRDGARVTRRYDTAKTPYRRLMDSPHVDPAQKRRLKARYESLNLADLHRRIQKLQRQLTRLGARASKPAEEKTA
jgi:hypothetical protein